MIETKGLNPLIAFSLKQRLTGWLVHLFTASGAVIGLYTLYAIYRGDFLFAFWLMGITIFIDSIDGALARHYQVKKTVPKIDGALLDNIVDYLNYVITPTFLLLTHPSLLPGGWNIFTASTIVLASAYQFTQNDAKTEDNFFKGFPSYWNLVVFYLFIFNVSPWLNTLILALLAVAVFIPMKYIYLTRMDHLTHNRLFKRGIILITILYGFVTVGLLWLYPQSNLFLVVYSFAYMLAYFGFSLYRTFVPLEE